MRLDEYLVKSGLADSREQAKRLILAGEVTVGGEPGGKPGSRVTGNEEVALKQRPRFVGRGGLKLDGALEAFGLKVAGAVGLDIGASTGGFTDCLLQRGAAKVYTLDVGTNQLVWKLRSDPRVIAREKFNARYLVPGDLPERVDVVVIDVSFISLSLILGPALAVLKQSGDLVCLIKPQFELRREDVGKGGIVRDEKLHDQAVDKIRKHAVDVLGAQWTGVVDSPITGTDGNREFFAWIRLRE
ncbi:MAG: TlyA family RNA methyltransferase [Verrucomicrobiales bacterium]